MKKSRRILLAMLMVACFSVGFRLPKSAASTSIGEASNIYIYDTLLLVSDSENGLHIYSIADRINPRRMLTISLDGNTGAAMKGDIVYANSYNAIMSLRIHDDSLYDIVEIIKKDPSGHDPFADEPYYGGGLLCACASPTAHAGNASGGGAGGSYAVFAVIDTFLYYLDENTLMTMSIQNPANPRKLSSTYIDWSVETLFPTPTHLYVGGTTGMYVLDRSTPSKPSVIGQISHFKSCDPVVVEDTVAYVTLRGGNRCGQSENVLMAVNVANPAKPQKMSTLRTPPPYGLAVSDTLLYVSEGLDGFALYNVKNPYSMKKVKTWNSPPAKDFIWFSNELFIMGFNTVSMYDAHDPIEPRFVSSVN